MNPKIFNQLRLLFAVSLLMVINYPAIAAPSKYKVFQDCLKYDGNKPEEMIENCTQATKIRPLGKKSLAQVYEILGIGHKLNGDIEEALDDYTRSIDLNPKNPTVYLNRSNIWVIKKDYKHAMSDLEVDRKMYPRFSYIYAARSEIWIKTGNFKKAVEDGDHAVALDPKSPTILNLGCWVHAVAGVRLKGALFTCTKAIKRSVNHADVYRSRGLVNLRLQKYKDAIKDESHALAIEKQADSLFIRGIAKSALGDEGAEDDISAAEKLEPDIAERYANWGITP